MMTTLDMTYSLEECFASSIYYGEAYHDGDFRHYLLSGKCFVSSIHYGEAYHDDVLGTICSLGKCFVSSI